MVEDGRFGGLRRSGVVVAGDGVEQLGKGVRLEPDRALLDQTGAQVDVAE